MNRFWIASALYILLIALAGTCMPVRAQSSLSLFDVDATNFPSVKGRFLATDNSGTMMAGLSSTDLEITENGRSRTIIAVSCPEPRPTRAISSVLAVDVSESMWFWDRDLLLAKAGAIAWVQALSFNGSECAVTAFEHFAYLYQDFTTDRGKLRDAVGRLRVMGGGTNFDAALLQQPAASIPVALRGKKKRMILLLTDGKGDGDEGRILDAASGGDITIYSVIIGRAAPQVLKNISTKTGGRWFENVTSKREIERIIYTIIFEIQGGEPCTVEWESGADCTPDRVAQLSIPRTSLNADVRYMAPVDTPPALELSPATVRFGAVPPGEYRDATVIITALNGPVRISSISSTDPKFQIIGGAVPPLFTLQPGEKHSINIRFTATDSGYAFAQFNVESDACSYASVYATAGFQGKGPMYPTVTLEYPNGGERFVVGSEVNVRWKGISPADPVRLLYSVDGGNRWDPMSDVTSGGSYRWRVPDIPSDNCLARIEVLPYDSIVTISPAGIGWFNGDGTTLASDAFTESFSGTLIWDPISGRLIRKLERQSGGLLGLSADSKRIMVTGIFESTQNPRLTQIYDVSSGAILHTMNPDLGYSSRFRRLVHDWSTIVVINSRNIQDRDGVDTIKVWEVDAERLKHTIATGRRFKSAYQSIELHPDGKLLVGLAEHAPDSLFIWDTQQGTFVRAIHSPQGNITIVAFIPNSDRVISLSQWNYNAGWSDERIMGTINIWDAGTGTLIDSFPVDRTRTAVPGSSIPQRVTVSEDGTLLAAIHRVADPDGANSGGEMVSIWNIATGKLWKTMKLRGITHGAIGKPVMSFSPDNRRLAVNVADSVLIWYLYSAPMQYDTSDQFWAIVRPQLRLSRIDMGKVLLGYSRDSLLSGYIHNTGTVPAQISGIKIQGDAEADFSLLSYDRLGELAPGDSIGIELGFKPSALGLRHAAINIMTPQGGTNSELVGEGIAPNLVLQTPVVDFGLVPVGDTRDTTISVMLQNIGTSQITITDVLQLGPDVGRFYLTAGGGSFTLLPEGSRQISLRFSPDAIGRTNGRLAFTYDGPGSPMIVQLFGQGVGGVVRIANDSGAPGDRRSVPLVLQGPRRYISDAGATKFIAEIRYNARLLAPYTGLERGPVLFGKQTVVVRGSWNGSSDTVGFAPFTVALGDTDRTEMEILRFAWAEDFQTSSLAEVETQNGLFHITGICYEGGARMIENTEEIVLKPSYPNPASKNATIEFQVIEDGHTELLLTDALGNPVLALVDGTIKPGKYTVTAPISSLPPGAYFYTLKTPTYRITRMLYIVR